MLFIIYYSSGFVVLIFSLLFDYSRKIFTQCGNTKVTSTLYNVCICIDNRSLFSRVEISTFFLPDYIAAMVY